MADSFGCPCGRDSHSEDEQKSSRRNKRYFDESDRIVGGTDLKKPSPWFMFLTFGYPGNPV